MVFHLSARKSGHPVLCPKSWVWGYPPTNPPSLAPSDHSVGSGGSQGSRHQSHSHAQSITPAHSWQSGSVGSVAGCHSVPTPLKMAKCQAASLNPPMMREMVLEKMTMPKKTRAGSKPLVMGRWHQMVKKGRSTLTPKTPSLALSRSLVDMRTQTQSWILERKSSPSGESGAQKAPRRTALRRSPANRHLLRRSHQWTRQSMMRPGKKHGCWTHVSMLGITTRLPKALQAG